MSEKELLNEENLNKVSGGDSDYRARRYYCITFRLSVNDLEETRYVPASVINNLEGATYTDKVKQYCSNQGWIFVSYTAS